MKKVFFLNTFLLMLCFISFSKAQTSAVSSEKKAIIAEIVSVTKADKNIA